MRIQAFAGWAAIPAYNQGAGDGRCKTVGERIALLQRLNQTAGIEGDFFPDTGDGDGDDALAPFILDSVKH